jgi:hypothetical protein
MSNARDQEWRSSFKISLMSRKRQQKQIDDVYELQDGQALCIVRKISSANMFECWDGLAESAIVAELPPRFRKTLWIRRGWLNDISEDLHLCFSQSGAGSYVIITLSENPSGDAAGKLQGEITSVLQADQIKRWKKNGTWYGLISTSFALH